MKFCFARTVSLVLVFLSSMSCQKANNMNKMQPINIHFPVFNLNLDPHKMEDAYSLTVVSQIYRGLFRYTPDGDIMPDLIERWSESNDKKKYIFKLKERSFSNGLEINSKHVVSSFARMFFLGSSMAADIDYIKGAKTFKKSLKIDDLGIKAIDEKSVEFTLEFPSSLFLKHLSVPDCAILPIKNFRDNLTDDHTIKSSGPYKVTFRSSTKIVLSKWRHDSFESKTPPTEISFFKSDSVEPLFLANTGSTDTFDDEFLEENVVNELINKGWKKFVTEITRERFVLLNPNKISLPVRKYLASKIDAEFLVKKLKMSFAIPAFGLVPAGMPGELSKNDVRQFREKFTNASVPHGAIELAYPGSDSYAKRTAEILKSMWEHPSFKVKLVPYLQEDLLSMMFQKKGTAIIGAKGTDYPDGYSVVNYFRSGYDSNYFYVNNKEIDRDLVALLKIFDSAKRVLAYKAVQLKILKQFTVLPLFFGSPASGLWSPKVEAVPPHPMGLHMLPFETIEMKN